MPRKVFVDSDVVISSLLSATGAAFLLLNQATDLDLFISNKSNEELEKVIEKLHIESPKLKHLVQKRFKTVNLDEPIEEIKTEYREYVFDIDDAHIVAGARKANAQFLISYNTKHFKAEKIKNKFSIILTTPSNLLQYLRSI